MSRIFQTTSILNNNPFDFRANHGGSHHRSSSSTKKDEAAPTPSIQENNPSALLAEIVNGTSRQEKSAEEIAAEQRAHLDEKIETEMRAAQKDIVAKYGEITINKGNIRLKYFGDYMSAHLFDVVDGMGMMLGKIDSGSTHVKNPNEPDLLFFAPKDPTHPAKKLFGKPGSFTDFWPDGDYVLIGWGYYADYDPANPMVVGSVPAEDLFMHEAGFHLSDGGFLMTPPEENYLGEVAVSAPSRKDYKNEIRQLAPGVFPLGAHGRVWDLHVWRSDLHTGEDTAPVISTYVPEEFNYLPKDTLDISVGFMDPEKPKENDSEETVAAK